MTRFQAHAAEYAKCSAGIAVFVGGSLAMVTTEGPGTFGTPARFLMQLASHIFGGGTVMTLGVWIFAKGLRGLRALKPFEIDRAAAAVVALAQKSHFRRVLVPQVASELALAPEQVERLLAWMETNGRCRRERVEGWEVFVFPEATGQVSPKG